MNTVKLYIFLKKDSNSLLRLCGQSYGELTVCCITPSL